jgi:hypothetical protein
MDGWMEGSRLIVGTFVGRLDGCKVVGAMDGRKEGSLLRVGSIVGGSEGCVDGK